MILIKVEGGVVVNSAIFDAPCEGWLDAGPDVGIGWVKSADDSFSPPVEDSESLTDDHKVELYRSAVGYVINSTARSYGFDSIITAVTYADEPADPKNQSLGLAFRQWRSLCWAKCRTDLEVWLSGSASEPTEPEVISGLPKFEAPND